MRRNIFQKIYDLFRYDIPRFVKNFWRFRKNLWNFRWYDYSYSLNMLRTSLQIMADNIETKGYEVDVSRLKKVAKMRRAIKIIDNMNGIEYISMAEKEIGLLHDTDWEFIPEGTEHYSIKDNLSEKEKEHNNKVYKRSTEIEQEEWEELWTILKGQRHEEYKNSKNKTWDEWFDGSGMNTWWD